MTENERNKLRESLFGLDDIVEDGLYCIPPTEEDMLVFQEHAKTRLNSQSKKQQTFQVVIVTPQIDKNNLKK